MAATNFDAHGQEADVTYDATEGEDGNWGTFRLIGVLVLTAAFVGFVYLAYFQGLKNGMKSPPTITAESGPYKTQPDDPGGRSFADAQSKAIHDRVNGAETDVTGTAAQAPPEAPLDLADASATGGPAEEIDIASLETVSDAPLVTGATPTPVRRPEGVTGSISPVSETLPEAAPAGREQVDAIASLSAPSATPTAASAVNAAAGAYLLQIASFPDRASAEQSWSRVSSKHGDLLVGLGPDYQVADIPNKGTYHRLRIGPFKSKAEATEVCNALKARKQDCIPIKN